MSESAAICRYRRRAIRRARSMSVGIKRISAPTSTYLHFGEATLTFPQTLILRYGRFEPPSAACRRRPRTGTRWFLSRLHARTPARNPRVPVRGAIHRGRRRGSATP